MGRYVVQDNITKLSSVIQNSLFYVINLKMRLLLCVKSFGSDYPLMQCHNLKNWNPKLTWPVKCFIKVVFGAVMLLHTCALICVETNSVTICSKPKSSVKRHAVLDVSFLNAFLSQQLSEHLTDFIILGTNTLPLETIQFSSFYL